MSCSPILPLSAQIELPFTIAPAYRTLAGFVRRVLGRYGVAASDVDDLVQEVFVTLHRKGAGFTDDDAARAWLFGTARRVASNHRRARERAHARVPAWGIAEPPSPERVIESTETLREVDRVAAGLSSDARAVFDLAAHEGLRAPEIAARLGLGLDTTYSHLRRVRQRFARALVIAVGVVLLLLALAAGNCATEAVDDRDRIALRAGTDARG